MTGERTLYSGKREESGFREGGLVLSRSPGQNVVILTEKGELINVIIHDVLPDGPRFSIETLAGLFKRTEEERHILITDQSGRRVSVSVDSTDSLTRAKVHISAPKEFKIFRGELIDRERDKFRRLQAEQNTL